MKIIQIIASETNMLEPYTIHFRLGVFDKSLDTKDKIIAAVKKACETYIKNTQRGQKEYRSNGNNFNWGDLAASSIYENICRDNGFCILPDSNAELITVDLNEQLVNKEI